MASSALASASSSVSPSVTTSGKSRHEDGEAATLLRLKNDRKAVICGHAMSAHAALSSPPRRGSGNWRTLSSRFSRSVRRVG